MEIINLNGVEYIKKERDEALEKLRIIENVLGQKNTQPIISKGVKDTDVYTVCESYQSLYDIRFMNDKGEFFLKNNRKVPFDIKAVFEVRKKLGIQSTVREARDLRKSLNLNEYGFGKLVYNNQYGIFDKFIDEWNERTQPKVGRVSLPTQNNPEKRKENGIYG